MSSTRVLKSEWTKIKSVNSTIWTLSLAAVVTIGLGMLISHFASSDFDKLDEKDRLGFDATSMSFAGMGLGQLAMIVFGVLVVSNEYSTGMIRTSLAAVPQRGKFLFSKVAVATALAFVVAMITAFISFFLGQSVMGVHKVSIGDPGVLRAVIGGGLYMTLIAVFSMAIASLLRSPMLSLGILMPLFFLVSPILGSVSATKKIARYLPDQAGQKVMQVVAPVDDSTPYGPWGGLAIMIAWVVVALGCGYLLLKKRDA
ncbi:ABC transporter permease [Streptomyces sp. T-3]|nr:ABC transporter permease [Streptomyces sp. T-3]